jgi:cell division protein FtsB
MAKNPIQILFKKIPKPFRNRYVLVLVLFLIWMVAFDKNNVQVQVNLSQTIKKLEQEKTYFEEEINKTRQGKYDIEQDIEKFARERYFMKRADEEVFVIVEEE